MYVLVPPMPPEPDGDQARSLRLWEPGHVPPRLVVENRVHDLDGGHAPGVFVVGVEVGGLGARLSGVELGCGKEPERDNRSMSGHVLCHERSFEPT